MSNPDRYHCGTCQSEKLRIEQTRDGMAVVCLNCGRRAEAAGLAWAFKDLQQAPIAPEAPSAPPTPA
jgi:DNA-directed RNA polymerase subunit RPC12/RpoP